MDLRAWRQTSGSSLNTQQKSGGLGGIIIEGAPGIGKSELVIHELISRGYTEEHDFTNPSTAEDPFYRMPVSMPLQEKEALLIKAFDEGAVVIIDEMNSSPMMERLLNDLLMGKNPRAIEGRVAKPGFMVIGTQNPVSMAGRRVASTALQRRMMTTELPEYHPDEIKTILLAKGVPNQEAEGMVEAYESNRAYAIKNNLSPVPNFRHVIDLAEHYLKSKAEQRLTPLQQLDCAIKRTYSGEEYDELREKATRAYHVLEALMDHRGEHDPVERDQINAYVRALVVAIDNPTVDHVQALEALSLEALHQSSSLDWQAAGIALMILSAAMFTAGIVITVATVGLATPVGVGLAVAGASLFAISAGSVYSVYDKHHHDQHQTHSKEDLRLFTQAVKTQVKTEDTTPEVKPPPGTSQ
ncbi:MAG: AAA family ATPase [Legionellaceae bacterium]|nr:AAA family ATPase [Legionellaceae bacterium]